MIAQPATLFEGLPAVVLNDTTQIIGRTMAAAEAIILRDLAEEGAIPPTEFKATLLRAHLIAAAEALSAIYPNAEPEDLAGLAARFIRDTLADAAAMGAVSRWQ